MLIKSIQEEGALYFFNIYVYRDQLIGIEEDPKYLQLSEMQDYGTSTDYFDWRATLKGFGSLLDVNGNPIFRKHPQFKQYHEILQSISFEENYPIRIWRNRVRK